MSIKFSTPLVNIEKPNFFAQAASCAETYLNFDSRCYRFIEMKVDQTIAVAESQLPKEHWFRTALKIASMILSLGIFPLAMFVIKCLYRFSHPLFINQIPLPSSDQQLSKVSFNPQPFLNNEEQNSSKTNSLIHAPSPPPISTRLLPPSNLEHHPTTILHKIFTEFFAPSELLSHTILNKHFNKIVNDDFMKWENLYKKITEGLQPAELKAFIQRIKMQYTQNKEPSYKQKVHYLCKELWEDARQLPRIHNIIQNEKLTMGDFMKKEQYDRFKILLQPARYTCLATFVKALVKNELLLFNFSKFLTKTNNIELFLNGDLSLNADLFLRALNAMREWCNTEEINQDLMNITELNLHHSSIYMLSTEILGYIMRMSHLQKLNLGQNNISILPNGIGKLTQLKEIDLESNQLSDLPESIGNLNQLQKLYLAYNKLSTLPESIENVRQLQIFDLRGNQFSTLPDSIKNFNELKIFRLGGNALSVLPTSIGNLKQLQELHLDHNNLRTLPDTIGNLSKLEVFTLHKNKLSALPKSIGKLKQLKRLPLEGNNFNFFAKRKIKKLLPHVKI